MLLACRRLSYWRVSGEVGLPASHPMMIWPSSSSSSSSISISSSSGSGSSALRDNVRDGGCSRMIERLNECDWITECVGWSPLFDLRESVARALIQAGVVERRTDRIRRLTGR
jgi:hypothetical protein